MVLKYLIVLEYLTARHYDFRCLFHSNGHNRLSLAAPFPYHENPDTTNTNTTLACLQVPNAHQFNIHFNSLISMKIQ